MPFLKSAESIRAKLHLSNTKNATIVGVCIAALIATVLVVQGFLGMTKASGFEIAKQDNLAQDEAGVGVEGQNSEVDTDIKESQPPIFIHVAGAVVVPGLYELPAGARVQQAIDAAGGFVEGAATSSLNTARILTDGEQVLVVLEADLAAQEALVPSSGGSSGTTSVPGGVVNINTADAGMLDTLPGVGLSTAEKIIADREANGPFKTIEDLKRVSGIGDKKYTQLADRICIG